MENQFFVFNEDGGNMQGVKEYSEDTTRKSGIQKFQIIDSRLHNRLFHDVTIITNAIAEAIAKQNPDMVVSPSNAGAVKSKIISALNQNVFGYDVFNGFNSGLVPKSSEDDRMYKRMLCADGSWNSLGEVAQMSGASNVADGLAGTVPQPLKGQQNLFLRADAKWAIPSIDGSNFVKYTDKVLWNLEFDEETNTISWLGKPNSDGDYAVLGGITLTQANENHPGLMPRLSDNTKVLFGDGVWRSIDIPDVNIPLASSEVDGMMSASDYSKLAGIEARANRYVLPSDLNVNSVTANKFIGELQGNVKSETIQSSKIISSSGDIITLKSDSFTAEDIEANNAVLSSIKLKYSTGVTELKALEDGSLNLKGVVKSVNGSTPDESGNVTLSISGGVGVNSLTYYQDNHLVSAVSVDAREVKLKHNDLELNLGDTGILLQKVSSREGEESVSGTLLSYIQNPDGSTTSIYTDSNGFKYVKSEEINQTPLSVSDVENLWNEIS